jgi:Protein of unknown function (DUF2490)
LTVGGTNEAPTDVTIRMIMALVLTLTGFWTRAAAQNTTTEVWPQVQAYINLDTNTRVFLLGSFNYKADKSDWQGTFGAHLDFALKPVFRRELRSRGDVFNKRFLSFRAGYRYITSLGDSSPSLERRWLVELTSRYLLPWQVVINDRSRGEMRFISGQAFSTRYRNRLQLERDFEAGPLVVTPYIDGELFYDTRSDAWNRVRYRAGAQIPAGDHVVLETYYLRQHDTRSSPPHTNGIGFTLNLYYR